MLTCTRYDHNNNVLADINNDLQQIGNNDYMVLFWNPLFCFLFCFGFVYMLCFTMITNNCSASSWRQSTDYILFLSIPAHISSDPF